MSYLTNFIFLWSLAILIVGAQSNEGMEVTVKAAFGWSILVACLGSLITFIVTFLTHRYYAKEIKRVFLQEMEEEQERVFKTAFVGELINIRSDSSVDGNHHDNLSNDETINDNQTEISTARRVFDPTAKGWKERDQYRLDVLKRKKVHKDKSILQLHTKRLNVMEECRAIQIATSARLKPTKQGKGKCNQF